MSIALSTVSEKLRYRVPIASMSRVNPTISGGVVSGMYSEQGKALSTVIAIASLP